MGTVLIASVGIMNLIVYIHKYIHYLVLFYFTKTASSIFTHRRCERSDVVCIFVFNNTEILSGHKYINGTICPKINKHILYII